MADIKNKNELKRRIGLFMDELDYYINEKFCKETMQMMREFIGHVSHRIDCLDSKIKSLQRKLKEYRQLEEQGLLLRLPCKVGSAVYLICSRYTKCTENEQEFDEYSCQGCECLECDSHREYYIYENNSVSLEWIIRNFEEFGKTVFLTRKEAEQTLKQMGE